MAPFSVADLKSRASVAKKRVGEGYTATRDKYSSTSSKDPGYNPPRPGSGGSHAPPPPPAPRGRPRQPSPSPPPDYEQGSHDSVDWANLTEEDKAVFFSWLDEFFSRYTGKPISTFAPTTRPKAPAAPRPVHAAPLAPALPRRTTSELSSTPSSPGVAPPPMPPRRTSSQASSTPPMPPRQSSQLASTPSDKALPPPRRNMPPPAPAGPPKPNFGTRPSLAPRGSAGPATAPGGDPTIDLRMTFPPIPTHGSNGADMAQYFAAGRIWGSGDNWYNSASPTPPMPPGVPQSQTRWAASTSSGGGTTTLSASLVFADMSVCYYRVTYPAGRHSPSDSRVRREAWYTLRPPSLPGGPLVAAHSAYGDIIASFAESYAGTGQYVSRGECWDLAHEALEVARGQYPDQAPVPSISRCHGHLIYCGRPGEGRWRGGDGCVRRGDIVEWRTVRIESGYGWATLGDPDHTAVIVQDCTPSVSVVDGSALTPAELGALTVVEQSVGSPPKLETYTLSGMTQGEMWIYRPICMREYVGFEFEVEPPPGAPVIAV